MGGFSADPLTIRQLNVTSTASLARAEISFNQVIQTAITSVASIASLVVPTNINASGASLTGLFTTAIVSATRDMTAATGSVAYTGAGFRPKAVAQFSSIAGQDNFSIGFGDQATTEARLERDDDNNFYIGGEFIYHVQAAGARQDATITSYDADGITLSWTKTGSPTGTLDIRFMFFRG